MRSENVQRLQSRANNYFNIAVSFEACLVCVAGWRLQTTEGHLAAEHLPRYENSSVRKRKFDSESFVLRLSCDAQ